MFPARFSPILFGLTLSGLMSFFVSGISTFRATGSLDAWLSAWLPSWAVAFPAVMIMAPITRKIVARLVQSE